MSPKRGHDFDSLPPFVSNSGVGVGPTRDTFARENLSAKAHVTASPKLESKTCLPIHPGTTPSSAPSGFQGHKDNRKRAAEALLDNNTTASARGLVLLQRHQITRILRNCNASVSVAQTSDPRTRWLLVTSALISSSEEKHFFNRPGKNTPY